MNAYCDECGTWTCDGSRHTLYDCDECGGELTVIVGPRSSNPEDGDEAYCDACGWTEAM